MIILKILLVLTLLGIINCFQWATAILAKQKGRSFNRWLVISFFLPIISLIVLVFFLDANPPDSVAKD